MDPGPRYSVSAKFSIPDWKDELSGKQDFYLPGGMRLLGVSGDGLMGAFAGDDLPVDAEIPCYSGSASEQLSLEAPPGVHFSTVPDDTHVKTAYLTFDAHWTLQGNTLSVERHFTSTINTPLCDASVRAADAAALKTIAHSYDTELSFESAVSDAGPLTEKSGERASPPASTAQPPTDPKLGAMLSDAISAVQQNDNAKGLGLLSELLQQPGLPTAISSAAYFERAMVYHRTDQFDKALADIQSAAALTPGDRRVLYGRARLYFIMTDWPHALADCNALLTTSPGEPSALMLKANIFMEEGNYQKAASNYAQVLHVEPYANAYFLQAVAYFKLGRRDDAQTDIKYATEAGDNRAQAEFDAITTSPAAVPSDDSIPPQAVTDHLREVARQSSGTTRPTPANSHAVGTYPPLSRRLGEEGNVLLAFTIEPDGSIDDIKIAKSSHFPLLDAAALAGARAWRYHPAMRGGKAIALAWDARVSMILN